VSPSLTEASAIETVESLSIIVTLALVSVIVTGELPFERVII